ncbi:MAG: ArsR/SmtB family transcription factor [Opitutales bacterium]
MQDLSSQQAAIFQNIARMGQALASPQRLKIVSLLTQGPKTVDRLAGLLGQSIASTSAHLKVLRHSGLVTGRKRGRELHCELASASVESLWLFMRNLGEELLPEVREVVHDYFEDPESLSALSEEELRRELAMNRVVLFDLRPEDEFAAGHLPGARHLPFSEIDAEPPSLSPDQRAFAYCRGPYCLMAIGGTARLQAMGLKVKRLGFGVPEWRQQGFDLEVSEA